ncbi:MAG: hypothetical protein ACFFB5_23295 [Promethearchaeota archaeon]
MSVRCCCVLEATNGSEMWRLQMAEEDYSGSLVEISENRLKAID